MTPIRFTYYDEALKEKAYVSILGQFTHHFTGETIYRVRIEEANGWVMEPFLNETDIQEMLKNRVEE
jgi:hypothetical protein